MLLSLLLWCIQKIFARPLLFSNVYAFFWICVFLHICVHLQDFFPYFEQGATSAAKRAACVRHGDAWGVFYAIEMQPSISAAGCPKPKPKLKPKPKPNPGLDPVAVCRERCFRCINITLLARAAHLLQFIWFLQSSSTTTAELQL